MIVMVTINTDIRVMRKVVTVVTMTIQILGL
jgi:hypothetical protein